MSVSATTHGLRPGVCTSTNRPTNPFDGQVIYMSDTNETAVWNGSYWEGLDKSRDRNVVINGAMQVAQRGSTALSVAVNVRNYGPVDRFYGFGQPADGVYSIEQSTDVPAFSNFTNSFKATCTTADASLSSGNQYAIGQMIEGTNSARLGFGSANAATVTLSFWVKSSLTGTYCCSLRNSGTNRSYVAEYSIAAADTWEKKSITIAGDTTGTWLTTTGAGIRVDWCLAAGTDLHATNATWSAGSKVATSNQVNWLSSSSSRTFFLTGVQLEAGSVATPFEFEDYGTTLRKCQRYYYRLEAGGGNADIASGVSNNTTTIFALVNFPTTLRVRPTTIETTGTASNYYLRRGDTGTAVATTLPTYNTASPSSCWIWSTAGSSFFTAGQGGFIGLIGAQNAYLAWSAEL